MRARLCAWVCSVVLLVAVVPLAALAASARDPDANKFAQLGKDSRYSAARRVTALPSSFFRQPRSPEQAALFPTPDAVEQQMINNNRMTASQAATEAGGSAGLPAAQPVYEVASEKDLPPGVRLQDVPTCSSPWKHMYTVATAGSASNSSQTCAADDLHELVGVPVSTVKIGRVGTMNSKVCMKRTGKVRGPVKVTVLSSHPSRCTEPAIPGVNVNTLPMDGFLFVDRPAMEVVSPGGYRISLDRDAVLVKCPGGLSRLRYWNSAVTLYDPQGRVVTSGPNTLSLPNIPKVGPTTAASFPGGQGDTVPAGVWTETVGNTITPAGRSPPQEDWAIVPSQGGLWPFAAKAETARPTASPTNARPASPAASRRLHKRRPLAPRASASAHAELAVLGATAAAATKGFSGHTTFFLPDDTVIFTASNFVTTGDVPHAQVYQATVVHHNKRVLITNGGESGAVGTVAISAVKRMPPNPHPPFGETVHVGRDGPQLVLQSGAIGNAYWGQDSRFGYSVVDGKTAALGST